METKMSEYEKFMEKLDITPITLPETVGMMESEDYRERFVAEYYQLKIRFDNLNTLITKLQAGTSTFIPTTPINTLEDQLYYMNEYMKILRVRAEIEKIDLFRKPVATPESIPIEFPEPEPEKESLPTTEEKASEDETNQDVVGKEE